jgi:hypothetical protein
VRRGQIGRAREPLGRWHSSVRGSAVYEHGRERSRGKILVLAPASSSHQAGVVCEYACMPSDAVGGSVRFAGI